MRLILLSTMAALCCAILGCQTGSQGAAGKTEEPKAEKNCKEGVTFEAGSRALAQLQLATHLAKWGRKVNSPWALMMAGKIMAGVHEEPLPELPKRVEVFDKVDAPSKKPQFHSPDSLFAEAKAMAGGDQTLLTAMAALSIDQVTAKGSEGGAKWLTDFAKPLSETSYTITFKGDELAQVLVDGDGSTNLVLLIYDDKNGNRGNLITQHTNAMDSSSVVWVPKRTGKFHLVVKNPGRFENFFHLRTN